MFEIFKSKVAKLEEATAAAQADIALFEQVVQNASAELERNPTAANLDRKRTAVANLERVRAKAVHATDPDELLVARHAAAKADATHRQIEGLEAKRADLQRSVAEATRDAEVVMVEYAVRLVAALERIAKIANADHALAFEIHMLRATIGETSESSEFDPTSIAFQVQGPPPVGPRMYVAMRAVLNAVDNTRLWSLLQSAANSGTHIFTPSPDVQKRVGDLVAAAKARAKV